MKLQLTGNNSEQYSGYTHINVEEMYKMDNIADNSCEDIVALGFFHEYTVPELQNVIREVVSKLRRGGALTFNFVNYHTFDVYKTDVETINSILSSSANVLTIKYVNELIASFGLKMITKETNPTTHETTIVAERV